VTPKSKLAIFKFKFGADLILKFATLFRRLNELKPYALVRLFWLCYWEAYQL